MNVQRRGPQGVHSSGYSAGISQDLAWIDTYEYSRMADGRMQSLAFAVSLRRLRVGLSLTKKKKGINPKWWGFEKE
jgi:hypothetical protein